MATILKATIKTDLGITNERKDANIETAIESAKIQMAMRGVRLIEETDPTTVNCIELYFYEGKIEPFALQASLVICSMLFSDRQISAGNSVEFSANRLQFSTVRNKLSTITQMFDRGMMSRNEGREILQMPGIGPET